MTRANSAAQPAAIRLFEDAIRENIRSKYAEDQLNAAIQRGATQYVILGRAVRNPDPRLSVYVPTDFNQQTLDAALQSSGFKRDQISFFSWFGATPYSSPAAVLKTLAFIGSMPSGSSVVFDYAVERSSLDFAQPMAMDPLVSRIGGPDEPLRLLIDPSALEGILRAAGFHHVEDIGPPAAGFAHFVSARV